MREREEFLEKFCFIEELSGHVGTEREHFLIGENGMYVPRSKDFLDKINDSRWTYELSACQVESRTKPQKELPAISFELAENIKNGLEIANTLGLRLVNHEVAPENMPLDVYQNSRYLKIVQHIPVETLRAACRVTGTHLHFGVKDMDHALALYNALLPHVAEYCALGDHSSGERLRLYKTMATNWQPPHYENAGQLFDTATAQGFVDNPRNCWHLMRISIHGTVELRMFGITDDIEEIVGWVDEVRRETQGVWR